MAAIESSIQDFRPMASMSRKIVFTDAAGGAEFKVKNGVGIYSPPSNWAYMPWPLVVRNNIPTSLGVRFGNKLSALEGFAALVGLVAMPDQVRNGELDIMCDNAGFVFSYEAKFSNCVYVYTLVKAIHDVGLGLACKVRVKKTLRCSNVLGEKLPVTVCLTLHSVHWSLSQQSVMKSLSQ